MDANSGSFAEIGARINCKIASCESAQEDDRKKRMKAVVDEITQEALKKGTAYEDWVRPSGTAPHPANRRPS